jgi:hypothetical protein
VLVVDVPEGALAQHAQHVWQLKEHQHVAALAHRPPEEPHEAGGVGDVLQRVAAHHHVGREVEIVLGEVVPDQAHTPTVVPVEALRHGGGIDPHAAVVAQLAEQGQELRLATPDLEDCLSPDGVPLDQVARQAIREVAEVR